MRIRDIVKAKDISGVVTIEPSATVRDLLNLLAEKNIGALVVSTDGQSVDGIVSERDVVRHIQRADKDALEERVEAIMTSTVHTCAPDADLDEVMGAMTERRIRHVPVVERGRPDRAGQHRRRGQAQDQRAAVRARPARQLRPPDLTPRAAPATR